MTDPADTILTNAGKPKRAANDSGSVEQFDITNQIDADVHQRRTVRNTATVLAGIRFTRTLMPGSRDQ